MKYSVTFTMKLNDNEFDSFSAIVEANGMVDALERAGERLRDSVVKGDAIAINALVLRQ